MFNDMAKLGNLEIFHWILNIMVSREYIKNPENFQVMKDTITYQYYILIQDILTETRDLDAVPKNEFTLKCIEDLQNLKLDYAKVFTILQKVINDIKVDDFISLYEESLKGSQIAKKVNKFQDELYSQVDGKSYTVLEVMEMLGYSNKNSVYNHINNGNLKAKNLSARKTIIYENDLEYFIQKTYKLSLTDYTRLSQSEKKALHKN